MFSSRLAHRALALSFMLLACLEQWRLLQRLLIRHINADHALLWFAASEWSRLSVREPTFYGQTYGVTFEAIPIAILHALGMPYESALPLALFALAWGAWLWLATSAFRRGMPLAGLIALAAPSLLNLDHWIVVGVIGTGVGRLLAAACAGLVLHGTSTRSRVFSAVTLGGLAVAFDTASLVLAGPALVWAGWKWLSARRYWLPAALGLLAPLAWVALNVWFTHVHPDHDMHKTWSFMPGLAPLISNISEPNRLLGPQSLEVWPSGAVIPLLLFVLLGLALYARAWREAAAVSCVIVQIVYLATLEKSLDEIGTLWYPAARMSLGVPMAAWFVGTLTFRACWMRFRPRQPVWSFARRLALPLLLVSVLSSAGVRALQWDERIVEIVQRAEQPDFLKLGRPEEIRALCATAKGAAKAFGAEIVAFPFTQNTANYACAALYPDLVTVSASYERRYWILNELAYTPLRRMILWGPGENACRMLRGRAPFKECQPVADGRAVALAWENKDPLQVLRVFGYKVRPFGPGCSPKVASTCAWWADRYYR